MKRSSKLQAGLILLSLLTVTWLLSGCAVMIYPHTTERSGEVRGRVLDAKTFLPIVGAEVCFVQDPPCFTYTDTNGRFHMKAVRNFHWLSGAGGSGYPNRKMATRNISQTNYVTRTGDWDGDAGDILLQPK